MKKNNVLTPFSLILALLGCMHVHSQSTLNAIQTATPFLNIASNARTGAYGEIASVSSSFYKDAGLNGNPALLSGYPRCVGGNMSYLAWLRNLVSNIYLFEHNSFYSINNKNAIGYRFNYFNLGEISYLTPGGTVEEVNPYELFHQLTYSHAFNNGLSAGAGVKYIRSDIAQGQTINGYDYHSSDAFAMDLGIHYATAFTFSENLTIHFNSGASLNNLGSRISYTDDPAMNSMYLPATLSLGLMVNPEWYVSDNITMSFDIAYQMDKLMVPTPPLVDSDSLDANGNPAILFGKRFPESVPESWIQSFYDAPDGFREELHEILHKLGTEVRLQYQDKLYAAILAGKLTEHITKGNRKYTTIGTGFGLFGFSLDTKLILDSGNSPVQKSWAITAGFCACLDGRAFRF